KRFTRRADLLYIESKEIVELDNLSGYEIRGGRCLVVAANEIHIFRGPRAFSQPEVEGQRTFQNPAAGRGDHEARQEAVEDDCLSQTDEGSAPVTGSHEQALLQCLTKCGSALVLQWRRRSSRTCRTRRSTRPPRAFATASSFDFVAMPRSSAWPTAAT